MITYTTVISGNKLVITAYKDGIEIDCKVLSVNVNNKMVLNG